MYIVINAFMWRVTHLGSVELSSDCDVYHKYLCAENVCDVPEPGLLTGGVGGATGAFSLGLSLKGAPGSPTKGPLNTCLKDRYTLIEQSDLNTPMSSHSILQRSIVASL